MKALHQALHALAWASLTGPGRPKTKELPADDKKGAEDAKDGDEESDEHSALKMLVQTVFPQARRHRQSPVGAQVRNAQLGRATQRPRARWSCAASFWLQALKLQKSLMGEHFARQGNQIARKLSRSITSLTVGRTAVAPVDAEARKVC